MVRYYRWALDDARREVQEGFPLLRGVKSTLVIRALGFLESFAEVERPRVATSLVKRSHRRAVGLTADSWGPEEEQVNRDYQDAMRILRPEEEWYRQALPLPSWGTANRSRRSTNGATRRRSVRGPW